MTYPEQNSQYTKRSVTETLLEALSQTGIRPNFSQPAKGRRSRLGQIAAAAAMVVAVAALGFVFLRTNDPLPPAEEPVAVLEIVRGSVWRDPVNDSLRQGSAGAVADGLHNARLLTLAAGEPIHAGTVIETGAPSSADSAGRASAGRAALRLAGGQSMRLDNDTRVRFASSSGVVLERGAVYVDSRGGSSIEVRTTLGVVRDIGTQFEVRLMSESDAGLSLRIRVREGSVIVDRDQQSDHATVGEELTVDRDGRVTRASSPIYGPHWGWVLDTAPAPEIAGQPLEVFLDWLSREGGWRVRFVDEGTAQLASTTILHGDIQDLTPREASAMVLHSSGLDYTLEGELLLVGPKKDQLAHR